MKTKSLAFAPLIIAAIACFPAIASAQEASDSTSSYQIGEQTNLNADQSKVGTDPTTAGQGPVRLARFSDVQGNVTWRSDDTQAWSDATNNLPLQQGAEIWVTEGGRAEIQFDDGSLLRLGNGAVATLQTLYSDSQGEFTEIKMSEGLSALRLKHPTSVFQIDTPIVSVKAEGPAKLRVGIDDSVEIAVREGEATVDGPAGKISVDSGGYLDLQNQDTEYNVANTPDPDSWDNWNDTRDDQLADENSASYLPSNIAIVAGNLGDCGDWHHDPEYGSVWCPRVEQADWRPYEYGHWVWCNPFGWTWVSNESWGWAPYHYGTWVHASYGWGWVPGPSHQYWCPGAVQFSNYNGNVCWAPLAPQDVHYPSYLNVGYSRGNWALSFSIGGCGVYYASGDHCEARPWRNDYINNRSWYGSRTTIYNNTTIINNNYSDNHYVAFNGRKGYGVTSASYQAFGGRGEYQPLHQNAGAIFQQGRSAGIQEYAGRPVAGPNFIRPTAESFTATRSFVAAPRIATIAQHRPVFQAPLPVGVARFAPVISRSNSPQYGAFNGVRRGGFTHLNAPAPYRNIPGGANQSSQSNPYRQNSDHQNTADTQVHPTTGYPQNGQTYIGGTNRQAQAPIHANPNAPANPFNNRPFNGAANSRPVYNAPANPTHQNTGTFDRNQPNAAALAANYHYSEGSHYNGWQHPTHQPAPSDKKAQTDDSKDKGRTNPQNPFSSPSH